MEQTHFELLENVIAKLFPTGSKLLRNPDDAPPEDRYYVIFGRTDPRWIIPQNPKHGGSAINLWRPTGLVSRIMWYFLTIFYQAGLLGAVPGIVPIGISLPDKSSWEHVGWKRQNPPFVIIFIRWPTPERKAIATLVDATTLMPEIIVKISMTPVSFYAILHEARTISALSDKHPGLAPRLLFVDEQKSIVSQEFIVGPINKRIFSRSHLEFLKKLRIDGAEIPLTKLTGELEERLKALTGIGKERINMLERLIELTDGGVSVPSMIVHGDFYFRNLVSTGADKLMAFDWEFSLEHGPPLWDLFHFHVHKELKPRKGYNLKDEVKNSPLCVEYMKELGIDDATYLKLYYHYIISETITLLSNDITQRGIVYPYREIILMELDRSFEEIL